MLGEVLRHYLRSGWANGLNQRRALLLLLVWSSPLLLALWAQVRIVWLCLLLGRTRIRRRVRQGAFRGTNVLMRLRSGIRRDHLCGHGTITRPMCSWGRGVRQMGAGVQSVRSCIGVITRRARRGCNARGVGSSCLSSREACVRGATRGTDRIICVEPLRRPSAVVGWRTRRSVAVGYGRLLRTSARGSLLRSGRWCWRRRGIGPRRIRPRGKDVVVARVGGECLALSAVSLLRTRS